MYWVGQILCVKKCEESEILFYILLKIILHGFSCFCTSCEQRH